MNNMKISNNSGEKKEVSITIKNKFGKLKYQWQDNFIWRIIKRLTKKDIRIPILTGYPTKFYKTKIK